MNNTLTHFPFSPWYRLLAIFVAITSIAGSCQAQSLRTSENLYDSVKLQSWSESGQLIFNDQQRNQGFSVPLNSLVRYGIGTYSRTGQGVMLTDGSLLIGRIAKISTESCEFTGQYFRATIPRPLIRSILVHAPGLSDIQQQWLQIAKSTSGSDDRIQTINGDWISGTIQHNSSGTIYAAGTVDRLHIISGETDRKIPWQQVRGIVFSPLLTNLFPPSIDTVTIGFQDGTRLVSTKIIGSPAGVWKFQLACGIEILTSGKQFPVDQVCYVGRPKFTTESIPGLIPLTDGLLRIRHTPMFGLPSNIELDKLRAGEGTTEVYRPSEVNKPAEVNTGWLENALRIPSSTQAVFRVTSGAKKLTAELLGDFNNPSAENTPTSTIVPVRCSISVVRSGGKVQEVWSVDVLLPQTPMVPVEVNLEQSQAVAIILSVEPTTSLQPVTESIWINPLLHAKP